MKYSKIKKRYEKIELDIFSNLIHEIEQSKTESKHVEGKCLRVSLFDYCELVYIDQRLVFLDSNGHHYGVYNEASLEDLIDILTKLK